MKTEVNLCGIKMKKLEELTISYVSIKLNLNINIQPKKIEECLTIKWLKYAQLLTIKLIILDIERGCKKMKVIRSINIEESIWKKLQELAKKENRSASNFIEYLIEKLEKGE